MRRKGGNSNRGSSSERIPLVFGVSGHRDLLPPDLPKLRKQLRHIFDRFRAAYPATPFKLLTPLAEGADRLAAQAALSSKAGLLVPLPMEQQEYERDFGTADSLAEFRRLLARADSHWEIPTALNRRGESRVRQYAEVGDFIARYSHVLILLWDGEDNKKVGGTAWVNRRREHWVKAAADPLRGINPFSYGPVILVVTPRASGALPRPQLETRGDLPPIEAEFVATLSKLQNPKRGGKKQKQPALYQLVYWAINRFNSGLLGSRGARNLRKKRQSATRSRL